LKPIRYARARAENIPSWIVNENRHDEPFEFIEKLKCYTTEESPSDDVDKHWKSKTSSTVAAGDTVDARKEAMSVGGREETEGEH
jgi:hypothetical protein